MTAFAEKRTFDAAKTSIFRPPVMMNRGWMLGAHHNLEGIDAPHRCRFLRLI
jgi:hypothetical protein